MKNERRRAKRADINIRIKLSEIQNVNTAGADEKENFVKVFDISRDGIGFICEKKLPMNALYDTTIRLNPGEEIKCIIEIIRCTAIDNGKFNYGCRFVGINSSDQFRVDVYQIIKDNIDDLDR